jgi:hypothetical protein
MIGTTIFFWSVEQSSDEDLSILSYHVEALLARFSGIKYHIFKLIFCSSLTYECHLRFRAQREQWSAEEAKSANDD